MKIFLDDARDPYPGWTLARSYDDAIDLLTANRGQVTHLSFDHDLGIVDDGLRHDDLADTGYDLVTWIEMLAAQGQWDMVPKRMTVHSANPVGRKNIQAAIDSINRMREKRD